MKKILPFTEKLDLPADTGVENDNVDDMIQKLDMAMQVCACLCVRVVYVCVDRER